MPTMAREVLNVNRAKCNTTGVSGDWNNLESIEVFIKYCEDNKKMPVYSIQCICLQICDTWFSVMCIHVKVLLKGLTNWLDDKRYLENYKWIVLRQTKAFHFYSEMFRE